MRIHTNVSTKEMHGPGRWLNVKELTLTVIDANIVLRYLLDDIPDQADKAAKLIEKQKVLIPHEVLAEVVYVLSGVYSVDRTEIASALRNFLAQSTVHVTKKDVASVAIDLYGSSRLDFVDCLLVGWHHAGRKVATFDQELMRELA
ncbi:MAG TPA: PIN domain-containing protein [Spirochaetales bacterium]|nr:PIN domain-containing protein [Spirochaetales bacterium]